MTEACLTLNMQLLIAMTSHEGMNN